MSLADKINQLSLIKTKFSDLGDLYKGAKKDLKNEYEKVDHYRKLFKNKDEFDALIDLNLQITALLEKYVATSKNIKQQVNNVIHTKERGILQHDYDRYANQDVSQSLIEQRNENISEEFVDLIKNVIHSVSDWRYSGCVIDPVDANFVKQLVANEPLYIVTENKINHKRIRKSLNSYYVKNRLRFYPKITYLPKHLGLTICVNQFEYMPLDEQGKIMSEIYSHTLPGGKMVITYNDCDYRASLEHTLEGLRFYSTKELTLGKACSIGWDIVKTETTNNGVWHYAILQKPGQLTSIKTSAPIIENIKVIDN